MGLFHSRHFTFHSKKMPGVANKNDNDSKPAYKIPGTLELNQHKIKKSLISLFIPVLFLL